MCWDCFFWGIFSIVAAEFFIGAFLMIISFKSAIEYEEEKEWTDEKKDKDDIA